MSVYRVTLFFGQAMDGASETYWTPDQSALSASKSVESMLALRAQMLNTNQYIAGVRAALETAVRRSSSMLPTRGLFADSGNYINIPGTGTIAPTGTNGLADQFRAVLQMQWRFNDTRQTIRYLSGIPDAISLTEPTTINFNAAQGWWNAYNAWTGFLVQNAWQIRAQILAPAAPTFPVVGLVQQNAAPGLLGIQISAATAPSITKGQKVALHGFRAAKGTRASTLNGTWAVDSIDNSGLPVYVTVYLRSSAGIDPEAQRFTTSTTLRPVNYTLYPIQAIVPYRVGIHKRGKPSLSPRGRRLTIHSLDP